MIGRGEVWWADLGEPRGSEPGHRRPILVAQNDAFNRSSLRTVVGIAITSNTKYVAAPGNVLLPAADSGLPRDSVANVTQLVTVDERYLNERAGRIPRRLMRRVDEGLRLVLDL